MIVPSKTEESEVLAGRAFPDLRLILGVSSKSQQHEHGSCYYNIAIKSMHTYSFHVIFKHCVSACHKQNGCLYYITLVKYLGTDSISFNRFSKVSYSLTAFMF